MTVTRTVSAAAVAALCALGVAFSATASSAPPVAQAVGVRGEAMTARDGVTNPSRPVALPHGADRKDVFVVAESRIPGGDRWAADGDISAASAPLPASHADGVSFEWRDAAAGALAALGVVALLAVGAYGLHARARRPASGAAS